ncbi:membrane frizzled-related protein-like [Mytilus edulis]|uniref:membrane frizzled-related protein-like n=1 Tax=Mytilus edulis TaxID=6550 RepID=UPI0039EF4AA6
MDFLFVCIICVVIINDAPCSTYNYRTYYMEDFCKYQITIKDPVILSLTKSLFYDHGYRCSIRLKVPQDHVVSIQFTRFDIGHPHMVYCDDSLHVFDGEDEETDEITVSKGLCGVTIPRPIVSSGRDVAIKFKSRYMSIGTGFQAVVTPMQADEMIKCDKSLFQCGDGYCINKTFVCDGYYNCMNERDESANFAHCPGVKAVWTDFSLFMKISFGVLLALSVLSIAGLAVFFTNRKEQKRFKLKLDHKN